MTSADTLPPSLRQLVDARLDSIDRVLLSTNITRNERQEIVQSVEDQVYELLSRRNEAEPTRDSLLAVLSMTDPPEAYLSTNVGIKEDRQSRGKSNLSSNTPVQQARQFTPLAIVSCVLGVLSLLSFFIWPVSAIAGLAATVCGSIALTQIYYSDRLKGVWLSIIGISSPAVAMITLFVLVSI